tara:strand:+ start:313 stop:627 length:315 start_codon:yes stop_codon:yes gene_type:complete
MSDFAVADALSDATDAFTDAVSDAVSDADVTTDTCTDADSTAYANADTDATGSDASLRNAFADAYIGPTVDADGLRAFSSYLNNQSLSNQSLLLQCFFLFEIDR